MQIIQSNFSDADSHSSNFIWGYFCNTSADEFWYHLQNIHHWAVFLLSIQVLTIPPLDLDTWELNNKLMPKVNYEQAKLNQDTWKTE